MLTPLGQLFWSGHLVPDGLHSHHTVSACRSSALYPDGPNRARQLPGPLHAHPVVCGSGVLALKLPCAFEQFDASFGQSCTGDRTHLGQASGGSDSVTWVEEARINLWLFFFIKLSPVHNKGHTRHLVSLSSEPFHAPLTRPRPS